MTGPRETDQAFSPEEAEQVRRSINAGRSPVSCPRCGVALTTGLPAGSNSTGLYWLYRCVPCKRGLTIAQART